MRNETAVAKPIISKKLFDKVQEILSERIEYKPKLNSSSKYLLSGLVVCGSCVRKMSGSSSKSGRNKSLLRSYACPNHKGIGGEKCPTKNINADYLELAVKNIAIKCINLHLKNVETSSEVFDTIKEETIQNKAKVSKIVNDLDKKIEKLIDFTANVNTSEVLIKRYQSQAEECAKVQDEHKKSLSDFDIQLKTINEYILNFKNKKLELTQEELFIDNETTREFIRVFIKSVTVKGEEIKIELND